MADILMADIVMVDIAMADIFMADIVMADIVMDDIVMADILMAHMVTALLGADPLFPSEHADGERRGATPVPKCQHWDTALDVNESCADRCKKKRSAPGRWIRRTART